jgi:hypothetical protein
MIIKTWIIGAVLLLTCIDSTQAYLVYSGKKGLGNSNGSTAETLALQKARVETMNVSWYYNWNIERNFSIDSAIEYVPMRHNRWWPNLDNLANIGEFKYLLTYNEPERSNQGNITVSQAISQWPTLEAVAAQYGVTLSSPATANPSHQWLSDFMTQAEPLDLQVDFMAMHKYPTPTTSGSILNGAQMLHDTYGKDVWITEFNAADWNGTNDYTQFQTYTWMVEVLFRLESTDYIKRYALFPWDATWGEQAKASHIFEIDVPSPGVTNKTANLTPLGKLYANYRSDDVYGPYTGSLYYLHNKANHERVSGLEGNLSTTNIYIEGDLVDFKLADAGNGNYFIVNQATNKRLGSNGLLPWNGGTMYWTDTSMGSDVQWMLSDAQDGWVFIDHALMGRRLYTHDGNLLGVGDPSWVGNYQKWAFIRSNSTVAEADMDGDGIINHLEFIAGTDASDSNSVFSVDFSSSSPLETTLNWDSVTGRTYSIEWTDELAEGFTNLHDNLAYPVNSYTDSVERVSDQNFYRIKARLH